MADKTHIEWPREIWMAERERYDQGVVSAVLSEWATVARWEGDKEREREFHRYVDEDIFETTVRYWKERAEKAEAALAKANTDKRSDLVRAYLTRMDDALLARDGSAELSHNEAKQVLRDVFLITIGQPVENDPFMVAKLDEVAG